MVLNKRRMLVLGAILAGGYLVASVILFIVQENLIFQGVPLSKDHTYKFSIPFEEVNLEMNDGATINALHFMVDNPKGIIIYFHGNAGNLDGWGKVAEDMIPLGYDIAIMDYRGYGKSTGNRTQKLLLSDAEVFFNHFSQKYPDELIILYGRSLGTGIATYVASKNDTDKLILETPYFSFTSLIQGIVPVYPAGPALKFKFKTNEYIRDVKCPIYIFHGTDDSVVPYKQGRRLYESIPEGRALFFTIEEGEHNNLSEYEGYWENLNSILE